MKAKKSPSYSSIERALQVLKTIPLWGTPPIFPQEAFEKGIQNSLKLETFRLSFKEVEPKPEADLLLGLGSDPVIMGFELTPLPQKVFLAIAQDDIDKLSKLLLTENKEDIFTDRELKEGFYQYLLLHSLSVIDEVKAFDDLVLKFSTKPFTLSPALTIDFSMNIHEQTLWGRLIIPQDFREAFTRHFSKTSKSLFDIPNKNQIMLDLHIILGSARLTLSEFNQLEKGDLLILDRSHYHLETQKGILPLTLEETPLFQVRIKKEGIKILDYADTYEDPFMNDQDDDKVEEFAEKPEENEEEALDQPIEEQTFEEPIRQEELIKPDQVPLNLNVEITRIKMSLEKLLQLTPGNVINLSVRPEEGVDLILAGKSIARGELIQIGDLLGVKILEIKK
ncbi:MAG: type III secretion system cytoplasmic ring protein SctQ [Simkaniaceae bacterium]